MADFPGVVTLHVNIKDGPVMRMAEAGNALGVKLVTHVQANDPRTFDPFVRDLADAWLAELRQILADAEVAP